LLYLLLLPFVVNKSMHECTVICRTKSAYPYP